MSYGISCMVAPCSSMGGLLMGIFKPGRPSGQEPPSQPGLYRFVDIVTGAIDYIGETSDLERRKGEHTRSGKFSPNTHSFVWKAADGRSTSRTRRIHEGSKIGQHNPFMNSRGGGGGRIAERQGTPGLGKVGDGVTETPIAIGVAVGAVVVVGTIAALKMRRDRKRRNAHR